MLVIKNFKDLTKSKQDILVIHPKSQWLMHKVQQQPTAIQTHRHLAEVNSRRYDGTGAIHCQLIC
jgi:hypothetical protein